MTALAFKLLTSPLLIYLVTLAGRRWGSTASGFLIGLPLTSGPISFILAYEYGLEFASQAAVGNLAGEMSNHAFCLTYIFLARRRSWPICTSLAIGVSFVATYLLNLVAWQLWPAFVTLLAVFIVSVRLAPRYPVSGPTLVAPAWDLPGRILCATVLVVTITTLADRLGPQLSGLISPFPVFCAIFAAFTHAQQGARSVTNLLRGFIVGSGSYLGFFVIVGAWLPTLGLGLAYLLASLAAIAIGGITFIVTREKGKP